jgi:anhydro-N-acetylmuramic acid kinase
MSGTSMDGIDLAFISSDGQKIIERKNFSYLPYEKNFKNRLSNLIYGKPTLHEIKSVENELTTLHAQLVNDFLAQNQIDRKEIDLISFHGHTIIHDPQNLITWQIGNAHLLAQLTGIDVVSDFRSKDVIHGGQGAPLVPIYHFHLFSNQKKPTAILNIGGISNITYLSKDDEHSIEAFDLCFGNAPLDDLMKKRMGCDFDKNGELARKGKVNFELTNQILKNEIFFKKPPKSFDRDDFSEILKPLEELEACDSLATLIHIHARAIEINLQFFNEKPLEILVCGGGRKNEEIIRVMKEILTGVEVKVVEEVGFNGDAVEAEAFAFLGIRSLLNLPISFHGTTGVKKPSEHDSSDPSPFKKYPHSCGGVLFRS